MKCRICGRDATLSLFVMSRVKFDPSLVICQRCRAGRAKSGGGNADTFPRAVLSRKTKKTS